MKLPIAQVKPAVFGHAQFTAFNVRATRLFEEWKAANSAQLKSFGREGHPKPLIESLSESLLATFKAAPLLDAYDLLMHEWHKSLLHEVVPPLIAKWEARLGVEVKGYFLQRMKTKWGSCNHKAGHIRLNTELVKKPKDLLEYVVVHELAHLLEPNHSDRFVSILDEHCPAWREARAELNELPLSAEVWKE